MKNGNDIIKFNTVTDPGILSAFADVYQKMRSGKSSDHLRTSA